MFLYNQSEDEFIAEGVRILYSQRMNVSIIQLMIAVTIFFCSFATINIFSYIWLALLIGVYITRLFMMNEFNKIPRTDAAVISWGRYYTYTALITGTCWGLSVYIFTSNYGITFAILSSLIILISLGSIISTAYWLEGFYAFIFPAILLLLFKLIISGDAVFVGAGVAIFIYFLGLCIYGKTSNKLTLDTISYKFKNLNIIAQLEQSNQSKSRFFAAANHDLRQPINSLNLIANSLASQPQTSRSQILLDNFETALDRLNHLLDSLLDISSLESGTTNYKMHHCRLEDIFKTILVEHLDQCRAKNLELRIRPTTHNVFSNDVALGRILSNLVNNAIKNTDEGGILVASREHWDSHICIEVWDTGVGIPADQQEQIFEEFYQIDNKARQSSDGLGLGLPICRRLADQLGHQLTVSSRPGRGTVMKLLVEKSIVTETKSAPLVSSRIENNLSGKTILLIEDDDMARMILADLLLQKGAMVSTAFDMDSALITCAKSASKFDLVISDYRLPPPANGIEVIDSVRTSLNQHDLAAILVSGDVKPDLSASTTAGETIYMSKPINMHKLVSTIEKLQTTAS